MIFSVAGVSEMCFPVFGKNVFRPTLKPKRKPEKNLKFGEDYQVSVSAQ
jgi:hypothetical protein